MNQSPAANRRAPRRRLLGLCIGLFIIWATCQAAAQPGVQPAAAAKTVSLPLKVCVTDGAAHVAAQVWLVNSPSNPSDVIKQPTEDRCYASPPIKLKVGQPYIIAATSEGRSGISQFTVTSGEREKAVEVRVGRQGAEGDAVIEICANDEGGKPLSVIDLTATEDQTRLTKQQAEDPECFRVSSQAADVYKLSLVTRRAQAPASVPPAALGALGAALLLITATTLTLAALLFLRFRKLAPQTARHAALEKVAQAVQLLSSDTPVIKQNVAALLRLADDSKAGARQTVERQEGAGAGCTRDVAPVPELAKTPAVQPSRSSDGAQRQGQNFDDAKLKYRELSGGRTVEHFYLMPSGSSTVSGMVEDTRVELHEQSRGTYVGFRSAVNEGEAMVFPMPNMHFSPETFKALFPDMTAHQYETGDIEPRLAVNTQPKVWKIV